MQNDFDNFCLYQGWGIRAGYPSAKLMGSFPQSTPTAMSGRAVLDGCSDLLVELFGDAGRHTRSAVGMAELPFDIAVEIELIARLRP